jgi:formimidoylglutamate deiminase
MISRSGWRCDAGLKTIGPADLIEIDLSHPALADLEAENLPSALLYGAGSGVVVGAWVEGKHVGVPDDTGG